MIRMSKVAVENIEKMRNYVINELAINFKYDLEKAKSMVYDSVFNELLLEEPDYVFHYSVGYWAKEVQNEYLS